MAQTDNAKEPQQSEEPVDVGRRRMVNAVLGGGMASWLAVALYPVIRYLRPLSESRSPSSVSLTAKDRKKIAETNFVIIRFGHERVIVLRDARRKLHANDAKCTHEGCTVQYAEEERLIWCACHNAKFTLDGKVISGPAPRPLKPYDVSESPSGKITVKKA